MCLQWGILMARTMWNHEPLLTGIWCSDIPWAFFASNLESDAYLGMPVFLWWRYWKINIFSVGLCEVLDRVLIYVCLHSILVLTLFHCLVGITLLSSLMSWFDVLKCSGNFISRICDDEMTLLAVECEMLRFLMCIHGKILTDHSEWSVMNSAVILRKADHISRTQTCKKKEKNPFQECHDLDHQCPPKAHVWKACPQWSSVQSWGL
jgi:hypothetical protein